MKPMGDPQLFEETLEILPNIKNNIEKTKYEMENYLEVSTGGKFEERKNEKEEEGIKRAESIYDRLDEIVQRRKVVIQNGKETIHLIDIVKFKIESVIKSCENDEIYLDNANDELILRIIELEERKRIRDIKPFQDKIDDINNKTNKRIQELGRNLKSYERYERYKRMKEEEEMVKKEIQQIEEWTEMKIGNVIFDSCIDNWNIGTSVFDQKILNKSNLLFVIKDFNRELFGGYVNAVVDKCDDFITDPKSFVFSLTSNGMVKHFTNPEEAFKMFNSSDEHLFEIKGNSFAVHSLKEEKRNESFVSRKIRKRKQRVRNTFITTFETTKFTTQRLWVIQLI